MSESQRFPTAVHALVYLAHSKATPHQPVRSVELACSVNASHVGVRRVTARLVKAGLIGSQDGRKGGAWLRADPERITLDQVLEAVAGPVRLGATPPSWADEPAGSLGTAIVAAIAQAEAAMLQRLSKISIADLVDATRPDGS
uniref:Transcriptional regulator, BadM/Rrf2 family n=1 Tax=Caulobacter sp. (strain K31) TaxID=366602 RepID=B0T994_CAUSK